MEKNDNSAFVLIAIVAIVAIVGLVVAVTGSRTSTSQSDVVGLAASKHYRLCPPECTAELTENMDECEDNNPYPTLGACYDMAVGIWAQCCDREPASAR